MFRLFPSQMFFIQSMLPVHCNRAHLTECEDCISFPIFNFPTDKPGNMHIYIYTHTFYKYFYELDKYT